MTVWTIVTHDGGVRQESAYTNITAALKVFNEAIELKVDKVGLFKDLQIIMKWENEP